MQKIERWMILIMLSLVILPRISFDLYLPSLPAISKAMGASESLSQMTLTSFMFGYSLSMLISGKLSDIFGGKKVLICGLFLYVAATFTCAITSSIFILIVARFFEALGGCCGTVIVRVIVKENYPQKQQIELLANLSAVMAICPLFIPVIGGAAQLHFGWNISFYLLTLFAVLVLVLVTLQLNDKKIVSKPFVLGALLEDYKNLVTNPSFIKYSLTIAFSWSCYFIFSFESPFILQKSLNFNPLIFGILYAIPISGYLLGTQLTKKLSNNVSLDKLINFASAILLAGSVLMLGFVLFFTLTWATLIVPMFIIMIGLGIIIPCCQVAVMQPFSEMAGTASGLFFFIQMTAGSVCGVILPCFKKDTLLVMSLAILVCSFIAFFVFNLSALLKTQFYTNANKL